MEDKRIAIMTWYTYRNYGTALQASALSKCISDMGMIPLFVKYIPKGDWNPQPMTYKTFLKKALEKILSILFCPKSYISKDQEALFVKYLSTRIKETSACESKAEFERLNEDHEAFICGSDQIWSPLYFDDKYFLSFVQNKASMVAYAPSFGVSEITDTQVRKMIKELLNSFSYLSVREIQGVRIIKQLTGQDAKLVLDPTLLLTADEWDRYAEIESAPLIPEAYILCYFLGEPAHYREYVRKQAKSWRLPVYEIPTKRVWGRYPDFPFEVGPREFVSLIRNAAFVFTDSFHGLVFSVNYETPFAVFERFSKNDPKSQNSRIYSFLNLMGMEDRLISPMRKEMIDQLRVIENASELRDRLHIMRQRSLRYLKDSLEAAVMSKRGS